MSDGGLLDTIELIYSAAVDPAAWGAVLSRLAEMTGCIAGGLTIEDPIHGSGKPITFFGFDPDHVRKCFDYFLPMNPLFAIESRMLPGFVVTNEMVVQDTQFRKSEFYDGWAKPQGLCSPVSLVLHREAGRYMPLTLVRPDGAGEASRDSVSLLKTLSPHLIRSMDIGLNMGRLDEASETLQTCLEYFPAGVVLLDRDDRVLRTNAVAEAHLRGGRINIRGNRILGRQSTANAAIQTSLAARRNNRSSVLEDIKLVDEGGPPLVISVIPVATGEASFDDGRVVTMLVIRSIGGTGSIDFSAFAKAHKLTTRESRLLELLAEEGSSLADCAVKLNVGLPTIKTHLQRTFEKTDTKRQTELLAKAFRSLLSHRDPRQGNF